VTSSRKKYNLDKNAPIGVFDSGIGGTTVLKSLQELLPNENYIFFGDSKNCPYGTKSLPELVEIVENAVCFLLEEQVKSIVVACNTATTQTIEFLREKYSFISFIGTEPAIKLACDSGKSNLLLLSTEGTAHSPRTEELVKENLRENQTIINLPCFGLAEAIETRDADRINQNLEKNFQDVKNPEAVDVVILGCTHYPLAKAEIQKFFPNAKLVDGGNGVARHTQELLRSQGLLSPSVKRGEIRYFFS